MAHSACSMLLPNSPSIVHGYSYKDKGRPEVIDQSWIESGRIGLRVWWVVKKRWGWKIRQLYPQLPQQLILVVTPTEAGVLLQRVLNALLVDSCLRRNDEPWVVGFALGERPPMQAPGYKSDNALVWLLLQIRLSNFRRRTTWVLSNYLLVVLFRFCCFVATLR